MRGHTEDQCRQRKEKQSDRFHSAVSFPRHGLWPRGHYRFKKHSPVKKRKAHDLKIVGSGKSTGSIAYKSNVKPSAEPTYAQIQRQQQQALLLRTATMQASTDIYLILAALLRAGKKNLAECGIFRRPWRFSLLA
jgi:hypothetical protein